MSLAELKFKLSTDAGDPTALYAEIVAVGPYGAIGPDGVSVARGFPKASFDAQGNLKLKAANGTLTPYQINPAEFLGAAYQITVKRGTTTVGEAIRFEPVAANSIVDVNNLLRQGRAQVVTPERLQSLSALEQSVTAAAAYAQAEGNRVDAGLIDLAQSEALRIANTDAAIAEALAVTGINPTYISETTALPPLGANGTKGAWRTSDGSLQRGVVQGGVWVASGTPITSAAAAAAIASTITSENLLPGGLLPMSSLAWQNPITSNLAAAIPGSTTPFGVLGGANPGGMWTSFNTRKMPIPAGTTQIKLRGYFKRGTAANIGFKVAALNTSNNVLGGFTTRTISSGSVPVATIDGWEVFELAPPAWPTGTVAYQVEVNLNYLKNAGQAEFGGVFVQAVNTVMAAEHIIPLRRYPSEAQITRALNESKSEAYALPTAADLPMSMLEKVEFGVAGDVDAYRATGDVSCLRRAIPLIDAVLAFRDDRRNPQWDDFRGIVRPVWSTDQLQPAGGTIGGARDIYATPPNPGVRATYPLHQGQITYPILSWVECVQQMAVQIPDLATKAAMYKVDCLATLDAIRADQYADYQHVTNNDPQPLLAGEGRFFLAYDSTQPVARREGYSYAPGGAEMQINMNMQLAAAYYVAYRVTRGSAAAIPANSLAYKAVADSLVRPWQRMLGYVAGQLTWRYTRAGVWYNTAWSGTAPTGNPYQAGRSAYTTNINERSSGGEDMAHACYTLRGAREAWMVSQDLLSEEQWRGVASTLSYFWPDADYNRCIALPVSLTAQGLQSAAGITTNTPPALIHEYAWLHALDPRIALLLRRWYASGRIPTYSVGMLAQFGVL